MAIGNMAESESYGKKYDFDSEWTGPLDNRRGPTDLKFLRIFALFLTAWLTVTVYASASLSIFSNLFFPSGDEPQDNATNSTGNTKNADDFVDFRVIFWKTILVSGSLSILYVLLLKWFTGLIVYTVISLVFIVLFFLTCVMGVVYANENDGFNLSVFIICAVFLATLLLLYVIYRKRIKLSCEVIKEASECISFFPSTVFFPVLPGLLHFVVIMLAFSVYTYLKVLSYDYQSSPSLLLFIKLLHAFNAFGFLWLSSFVSGFLQMILSGTFATWYWTHDKIYVPRFTLFRFVHVIARNHLGTLAFGSMIMTLCQFIRILLNFIKKFFAGRCNPCACFCEGLFEHFFSNLERFVKYINRNAYVMCAVHGHDFMTSAKQAFNLLMRNIVNTLISHKISEGVLFLGQLIVIGVTLLIAHVTYISHNDSASSAFTIAFFIATMTTHFFFMVIRAAIETIFHCVLEDYERNDGSSDRPYYMSFKLKNLIFNE